jgi:YVTN family beta-propeller protein
MHRLLCLVTVIACSAAAQTVERPVRAVTDPGVVTTRQTITPAGVPSVFQGRVYGVVFGADASEIWVLHASSVYRMNWRGNRVIERLALDGTPGLQGIRYDEESKRAIAVSMKARKVNLLASREGGTTVLAPELGSHIGGAMALGNGLAAIPLTFDNKLAIVETATGKTRGSVNTGIAPFGVAMNRAGTMAYGSNWGGRTPTAKDLTAPTGLAPNADRVVVDARGVAASGTVTRVDVNTLQVTHTIPVQLHPTAIVWDEARHRVYVANSNSDSVSVLDDRDHKVIRTIAVQPFPTKVAGIAPTALAISPDGARLYVACGGINAVALIATATGVLEGTIPTAWYPNSLALSPDGKQLAIGSLLGAGSGWRDAPSQRFVHAYRGAVNVVDLPDAAQLANYTTAVAENNRMTLAVPATRRTAKAAPAAIPAKVGDPSPIQHVVYIVKENRTYDQVFGDMTKGNGDPSLVMFGEPVTPNQHRLSDQFVLLDNFYASGGNSADGHQWLTQANETAYCLWPGYLGRSYPFDGSDPIAYSSSGFLWDLALQRGKTVRIYGEYAGRMAESAGKQRSDLLARWRQDADFTKEWHITAPIESLNKILARNYPSYTNAIPDVVRASIFLADLKQWNESGTMPNLTVIQLPSDHTFGTTPGVSTPKAMVADNDLALGQIVEALTKSKFWKTMAIFVVEDDAQNGVDHVDGHRTTALAISPYTRRGHVDSTFYSHQSMLKTMELILGLPTMSIFDLIANDMRASFQEIPDYTTYDAVVPEQSLDDLNPPLRALKGAEREGALASMRMRWDVPDAVPTEKLNRIVWHSVRGWNTKYPGTRNALFAPLSLDIDDDDR